MNYISHIYAVVEGNYFPREIYSLWIDEEDAEAELYKYSSENVHVERLPIGEEL